MHFSEIRLYTVAFHQLCNTENCILLHSAHHIVFSDEKVVCFQRKCGKRSKAAVYSGFPEKNSAAGYAVSAACDADYETYENCSDYVGYQRQQRKFTFKWYKAYRVSRHRAYRAA